MAGRDEVIRVQRPTDQGTYSVVIHADVLVDSG